MKITCEYCTNTFNDTEENCPHCGAPNPNVVRSTTDQPKTIKDLKDWYTSKGLPPYETTRFFIGINHTGPRAFGIYKDPKSGNFVVYKNKDNGQRAIRYEGTDEAYAVNELFMRLKQEIIQQKMNNVNKASAKGIRQSSSPSKDPSKTASRSSVLPRRKASKRISALVIITVVLTIISSMYSEFKNTISPDDGYYSCEGTIYYHSPSEYGSSNWFRYDSDLNDYVPLLSDLDAPTEIIQRKLANDFFLSKKWDASYNCPDFTDTQWNKDTQVSFFPNKGYYIFDNITYYHLLPYSADMWYEYNNEWTEITYNNLPSDMKHAAIVEKYYMGEKYYTSFAASDFTQTLYYQDYMTNEINEGYYRADDDVYYHFGDYYATNWYIYNNANDDWEYVSKNDLPDSLSHSSTVDDFYFTPTWDSSTQFSDFEDSSAYEDATSTNDDSDYSWDSRDDSYDYNWSNDSWDSGGSDWDNDW